MRISRPQALGWRMRRHLLDPVGAASVAEVVHALCAVPAQPRAAAELAVATRRARPRPDDLERALADGGVVKSYAFRGATHLMTPEDAAAVLALRAAGRMWERRSWQSFYGLEPGDWPALRAAVREALTDGPLTRDELADAVASQHRFGHLRSALADGGDTILKPLAWQGDLCFGPSRDGRATFQGLDANPRWSGLPDLDEAGPRAVEAYLRSYAPTTPRHLQYWLGEGLGAGGRRVTGWLDGLSDRVAELEVDGDPALLLRDDLDELAAASATTVVRLLPRYDQWVLGPGTADASVVPPAIRAQVSRGASVVIVGGVVSGTWSLRDDRVVVAWSPGAARPDDDAAAEAVGRLATALGRSLEPDMHTVTTTATEH